MRRGPGLPLRLFRLLAHPLSPLQRSRAQGRPTRIPIPPLQHARATLWPAPPGRGAGRRAGAMGREGGKRARSLGARAHCSFAPRSLRELRSPPTHLLTHAPPHPHTQAHQATSSTHPLAEKRRRTHRKKRRRPERDLLSRPAASTPDSLLSLPSRPHTPIMPMPDRINGLPVKTGAWDDAEDDLLARWQAELGNR